jgi:hypothetical protein
MIESHSHSEIECRRRWSHMTYTLYFSYSFKLTVSHTDYNLLRRRSRGRCGYRSGLRRPRTLGEGFIGHILVGSLEIPDVISQSSNDVSSHRGNPISDTIERARLVRTKATSAIVRMPYYRLYDIDTQNWRAVKDRGVRKRSWDSRR